ncbi:MAG: hypothetical protein KC543_13245 [Myxococcales bacterium]|nr:hypothetical protein [Myxococcales bacterium]
MRTTRPPVLVLAALLLVACHHGSTAPTTPRPLAAVPSAAYLPADISGAVRVDVAKLRATQIWARLDKAANDAGALDSDAHAEAARAHDILNRTREILVAVSTKDADHGIAVLRGQYTPEDLQGWPDEGTPETYRGHVLDGPNGTDDHRATVLGPDTLVLGSTAWVRHAVDVTIDGPQAGVAPSRAIALLPKEGDIAVAFAPDAAEQQRADVREASGWLSFANGAHARAHVVAEDAEVAAALVKHLLETQQQLMAEQLVHVAKLDAVIESFRVERHGQEVFASLDIDQPTLDDVVNRLEAVVSMMLSAQSNNAKSGAPSSKAGAPSSKAGAPSGAGAPSSKTGAPSAR